VANAIRKASGPNNLGLRGGHNLSAEGCKYFTCNELLGQDGKIILDVAVPLLAAMAKDAATLHARFGGSTVNLNDGDLVGTRRFAVSVYPEHSVELAEAPTWELLFAFSVLHAGLLLLPDHALGTWFDRQRKLNVLDIVICPSSFDDAIHLGIRHGQRAIFDLHAKTEVPLIPVPEREFPSSDVQETL